MQNMICNLSFTYAPLGWYCWFYQSHLPPRRQHHEALEFGHSGTQKDQVHLDTSSTRVGLVLPQSVYFCRLLQTLLAKPQTTPESGITRM